MKLKLAFGIASAAMLLSACGDDAVTNINDEAKDKGMVTLKVVDYNTGAVLDSAEIYSLIDANTLYTDSLGIVSWENEVIGDYEYTINKEGYATRTVKVTLQENSGGDMARVEDRIQEVKMYKKGVSVKGTVLLKDPHSGNLSAASKVKVVLSYENDFIVPAEIATLTDSSGVYEFKNLAEGLGYTVRVPQATVNGKTYAWANQKRVEQALRSGEQRVLDQVTMEVVGLDPELIKHNLQTIEANEAAKLTFSTTLLADSVPTSWKVYKGSASAAVGAYLDDLGNLVTVGDVCSAGTSVLTSAKLDKDGKTVVITPVSEKWTRLATYCISGVVYTGEGKSVSVAKTFIPGSSVSRPGLVTELASEDYYGRYIMLSWKPTGDEIKGYRVYFKTNESADFEEYKGWGNSDAVVAIDSASCKNVTSPTDAACEDLYSEYGSEYRTEVNYWWYTDSVAQKISGDDYDSYDRNQYTKSMYIWSTATTTVTCVVPYGKYTQCDAYAEYGSYYDYSYTGEYDDDDNALYEYIWKGNKMLPAPDTCVKYSNVSGSTSYTTCDQYTDYGKAYDDAVVEFYKVVYKDSVSCTVSQSNLGGLYVGDYTTNAKCQLLQDEFKTNPRNTNYNYWWYTEYVPVKPTAKSFMAFISTNSVVSDETASVKFIVLPYVVVGNDTVLADGVKATPTEFKIGDDE